MLAQFSFDRQRTLRFQIDTHESQQRVGHRRPRRILRHLLAQHPALAVELHHLAVDTQLIPNTAGLR